MVTFNDFFPDRGPEASFRRTQGPPELRDAPPEVRDVPELCAPAQERQTEAEALDHVAGTELVATSQWPAILPSTT